MKVLGRKENRQLVFVPPESSAGDGLVAERMTQQQFPVLKQTQAAAQNISVLQPRDQKCARCAVAPEGKPQPATRAARGNNGVRLFPARHSGPEEKWLPFPRKAQESP